MTDLSMTALPGVETFVVAPDGLGVGLRISIARPPASPLGAPATNPAVIYVLDADYCFGTVVEAARMGFYGGEVGAAVVVGVGYADEGGDYRFVGHRRGLDFYRGPRRTLDVPGVGALELGGAEAFRAALLDDVIPEVERRAAETVGARRVLVGMSAGGHFAAFVLASRPEAFAGYALMSPALFDFPPTPGAAPLVADVQDLPPGTIPQGTAVFLSAGAQEEDPAEPLAAAAIITNIYRMRAALAVHGAATELVVFPGETHISVMGAAVARALRFLLPPAGAAAWQVALSAETTPGNAR